MEIIGIKGKEDAAVYFKENKLNNINNEFTELTGYTYEDVLGKSLDKLARILRSNVEDYFDKGDTYEGYIFTKTDEPKSIRVTHESLDDKGERIIFTVDEYNMFLQGLLSNCINTPGNTIVSEAIYTYPDLIHLKTNDNYLDNFKDFLPEGSKTIGYPHVLLDHVIEHLNKEGYYYSELEEYIDNQGNSQYLTVQANVVGYGERKFLKLNFLNITEQILTKKTIKKQNSEMRIILDNIPNSIVKLNTKGEYTYTNQFNLNKLSPHRADDDPLNNKEVFKYFKYNDIDGRELNFEETPDVRVLNGEKLTDYTVIGTGSQATTYHECNGIPIYDDCGNVESAVMIYKDIEHAYKIEEYNALAENIKHLDINYATISYKDFKIKYMNEGAFESVKVTHPHVENLIEVIGENFFDYYACHTDDKEMIMADIKSSFKDQSSSYTYTEKLVEKGRTEYIKTIFQPVFDKNKEIDRITCVGMYITDEEEARENMAKALRAQEEIFVNTSHELKTPINLIFSASQLLNIYIENESNDSKLKKIKHSNKIITQNCYRTIKLINNILDVSKMEQGFYELRFKNVNIVDVLDNMVMSVSDYIRDKKLSIIFDPDVEEKIMAIDIYMFERIMLNLISNAIKFSNDDGVIFIGLMDKGSYIELSVRDQGIGIYREGLNSIFNKFKQEDKALNRNTEGTGIGLSLVKSIIELHDGSIDVESTLNVGTKFTIRLPAKTLEETIVIEDDYKCEDRVDMIRFELSDIYD